MSWRYFWCWLTHWDGHDYQTHFTFDNPPFMPYLVCKNCGKEVG